MLLLTTSPLLPSGRRGIQGDEVLKWQISNKQAALCSVNVYWDIMSGRLQGDLIPNPSPKREGLLLKAEHFIIMLSKQY
jgi:hypothetical protein